MSGSVALAMSEAGSRPAKPSAVAGLSAFEPNKVPVVALAFWIIKIAATTLGETGGDALSMSAGLGYLASTGVFGALFLIAVTAQIRASAFHPLLYWATIVATTTVGTTLADFADRSLGVGYAGGASILFALTMLVLFAWRATLGSVSVAAIVTPKAEAFYWAAILSANTLGTALGDWVADDGGYGFDGGALIFAGLLTLVALAYLFTGVSRALLFWAAFILTRPLGATLGDMLTKPHAEGGLDLSRVASSLALAAFMIACILWRERRGGEKRNQP